MLNVPTREVGEYCGAFSEYLLFVVIGTGGGKGDEDSDDDEPAAKKKATPALVSIIS